MDAPTMQVEIDLFSGRPNPVWDLTAAEVPALRARLEALPAAASATLPDRLGYRGLRAGPLEVEPGVEEPGSANPIIAVEVGGGVINATRRDGTTVSLMDPRQSVECWLLTVAQGRVAEPIRQAALVDLGSVCP